MWLHCTSTTTAQARRRLDEFVAHQKRDISNTEASLGELEERCNEVCCRWLPEGPWRCVLRVADRVHSRAAAQTITLCDTQRRGHSRTLMRIKQVWKQHVPELQVRLLALLFS